MKMFGQARARASVAECANRKEGRHISGAFVVWCARQLVVRVVFSLHDAGKIGVCEKIRFFDFMNLLKLY